MLILNSKCTGKQNTNFKRVQFKDSDWQKVLFVARLKMSYFLREDWKEDFARVMIYYPQMFTVPLLP